MKLHFLATGDAPERYSFDGDTITAEKNGVSEQFDLSTLQHGDPWPDVVVDDLPLSPGHVVRHAERDAQGELHVTLCQAVGSNDWTEQDGWIDASEYDPNTCYVRLVGIKRVGVDVNDYEPQWSDQHGEWRAEKING
jgi:hypothetical protein